MVIASLCVSLVGLVRLTSCLLQCWKLCEYRCFCCFCSLESNREIGGEENERERERDTRLCSVCCQRSAAGGSSTAQPKATRWYRNERKTITVIQSSLSMTPIWWSITTESCMTWILYFPIPLQMDSIRILTGFILWDVDYYHTVYLLGRVQRERVNTEGSSAEWKWWGNHSPWSELIRPH